jgi:hypothetical protein
MPTQTIHPDPASERGAAIMAQGRRGATVSVTRDRSPRHPAPRPNRPDNPPPSPDRPVNAPASAPVGTPGNAAHARRDPPGGDYFSGSRSQGSGFLVAGKR